MHPVGRGHIFRGLRPFLFVLLCGARQMSAQEAVATQDEAVRKLQTRMDELKAQMAEIQSELNAIHPFREGNGRSQLSFMYLVGLRGGHPLRLGAIRRETFLPAMIESFNGHLEPLIAELDALTI